MSGGATKRWREFAAKLHAESSLPYACVFNVGPAYRLPELSMDRYPGLLACHVVREPGCGWLLAYWQDEHHQRVYGGDFARDVAVERIGAGFITDVKLPRAKFWKRVPWKEAVLTPAALAGAFFVLSDPFARLIATPDVSVQFDEASEYIEVVNNSPTWVGVRIISKVSYTSTAVNSIVPTIEPKPPGKEGEDWRIVPDTAAVPPRLSPGQPAPARVLVKLKHNHPGNPPEAYDLSVTVAATAGLVWGQKLFPPKKHRVRVWSPGLAVSVPVLAGADPKNPKRCGYQVVLYSASAVKDGVELTINLKPLLQEDTSFEVEGPDLDPKMKRSNDAKDMRGRHIQTLPLTALREVPIDITVASVSGFKPGVCEKMRNNLLITFP